MLDCGPIWANSRLRGGSGAVLILSSLATALSFRFLHTADLHLDSPLVALALRDPALAESVGIATRTALTRIVDLCLAEKVDALLIAGDLWDGSQTSAKTPGFLKQELARLGEAGVRSFVIRGNHDAMSRVTRELDPPPGTTIFDSRPRTERFEAGGLAVAIHGVSFAEPSAPGSLLPLYPPAQTGAFNIGMMHTSLNGSAGHDIYAPCSLADLEAHGYDYWALGHIHRRMEHRGRAAVVMPGVPQGRDIGESGPASVTLGVVDETGLRLEQRSVALLRFDRLAVDLAGSADWGDAVAALDRALREAATLPRPEEHLVLRPRLTGNTPLAWRIARDLDRLTDEARASASGMAGLWIDRLENATALSSGAERDGAGNLPDDLLRLLREDLADDPALSNAVADMARDLLRDLPPELRGLLGDDDAAFATACADLLRQGSDTILARLAPVGEA